MAPAIAPAASDGKALFERRCIACHKLPDPDKPPEDGWQHRLQQMAPLAGLNSKQKSAVLDYLVAHTKSSLQQASLDEDRQLFESKCSNCHTLDRIFIEQPGPDEIKHIVAQMQSKSGTDWLSDTDVERIINYLESATSAPRIPPSMDANASGEEIFSARCKGCHDLQQALQYLEPGQQQMDWSHVVSRMRGKAPQWISVEEAQAIQEFLSQQSGSKQSAD